MTYEYQCTACGHQWEADQSINDKPLKKCPSCSKLKAQRQISGGAGFILKGGGWYADGYASSGSGSSAASSSKPSSTPAPSKETPKTDSKKSSGKKPSGEAA